jgi:hypothetical protein
VTRRDNCLFAVYVKAKSADALVRSTNFTSALSIKLSGSPPPGPRGGVGGSGGLIRAAVRGVSLIHARARQLIHISLIHNGDGPSTGELPAELIQQRRPRLATGGHSDVVAVCRQSIHS